MQATDYVVKLRISTSKEQAGRRTERGKENECLVVLANPHDKTRSVKNMVSVGNYARRQN